MVRKTALVLFLIVFYAASALAITVEAVGEAEIVRNDIPSAKNMAVSRAKWAALEQASGVKIKLDTIINNASLADEAVKTELSGTVERFSITDEGKDGNIYWVSIKAEVMPDAAKNLVSGFSKNTSIAVLLPAILPSGEVLYGQPFSEAVIKGLMEKGFEVTDVASSGEVAASALDSALKTGNYAALRKLAGKYMASTVLIGRIKVISKGNDVGYSKVNFSIVSGELDWRLIGRPKGADIVIASGSLTGRGQGAVETDAAYGMLKSMAKNASVKLVSAVSQKILGENAKTIRVVLKNGNGPRSLKELIDDVKNIPFVLGVKEQGISAVFADYPEKTYYLASFLSKNGKYRVMRLDEDEIIIERQ